LFVAIHQHCDLVGTGLQFRFDNYEAKMIELEGK